MDRVHERLLDVAVARAFPDERCAKPVDVERAFCERRVCRGVSDLWACGEGVRCTPRVLNPGYLCRAEFPTKFK